MEQSIIQTFYEMWAESAEYYTQSTVENEKYSKCKVAIAEAIGEKAGCDISDNIIDLVCEAEIAGFENGLRYGIMFMSGMLKGGAMA